MKQEDLVVAYENLLGSLNCTHEDGYLNYNQLGTDQPLTAEGKRLVLPTRSILSRLDNNGCIAFHPVCESVVRGHSPVIRKLQRLVSSRLTYVINDLLNRLLGIAMDTSRHSTLSPQQKEFLSLVPEISPDCHKQLVSILKEVDYNGKYRTINIYIKNGATIDSERFKRGAIINFPLMDELLSTGTKVFGKTVTKKNKEVIKNLLRFILDVTDDDYNTKYCVGTNSDIAPNFHCLVNAYANISEALNIVSTGYGTAIPSEAGLVIDVSWSDVFEDLKDCVGILPVLSGNEGDIISGDPAQEPEKPVEATRSTVNKPVSIAAASIAAPPSSSLAAPVRTNTSPAPSAPTYAGRQHGDAEAVREWSGAMQHRQQEHERDRPRSRDYRDDDRYRDSRDYRDDRYYDAPRDDRYRDSRDYRDDGYDPRPSVSSRGATARRDPRDDRGYRDNGRGRDYYDDRSYREEPRTRALPLTNGKIIDVAVSRDDYRDDRYRDDYRREPVRDYRR